LYNPNNMQYSAYEDTPSNMLPVYAAYEAAQEATPAATTTTAPTNTWVFDPITGWTEEAVDPVAGWTKEEAAAAAAAAEFPSSSTTSSFTSSASTTTTSPSSYERWLPVKTYIILASMFTFIGIVFDLFLACVALKEHREKKEQKREQEEEAQKTATDILWQDGIMSGNFWSKLGNSFFESDATNQQHEEHWVWWRHANVAIEEVPQLVLLILFYVDWSRSQEDTDTSDNTTSPKGNKSYWDETVASIYVSATFTSIMLLKVMIGYILYRRNKRKLNQQLAEAKSKGIFASISKSTKDQDDPDSAERGRASFNSKSMRSSSLSPSTNEKKDNTKTTKKNTVTFMPTSTNKNSKTDQDTSSAFFSRLQEEQYKDHTSSNKTKKKNYAERRPSSSTNLATGSSKRSSGNKSKSNKSMAGAPVSTKKGSLMKLASTYGKNSSGDDTSTSSSTDSTRKTKKRKQLAVNDVTVLEWLWTSRTGTTGADEEQGTVASSPLACCGLASSPSSTAASTSTSTVPSSYFCADKN